MGILDVLLGYLGELIHIMILNASTFGASVHFFLERIRTRRKKK